MINLSEIERPLLLQRTLLFWFYFKDKIAFGWKLFYLYT